MSSRSKQIYWQLVRLRRSGRKDTHGLVKTTAMSDIDAHGGLTFSSFCAEDEKEHAICHLPAPGEADKVWWFGFDCAHAGDLMPALDAKLKQTGISLASEAVRQMMRCDTYRNLAYVQNQCAQIAQQLVKVTSGISLDRQ